jgi:hypothetical protein
MTVPTANASNNGCGFGVLVVRTTSVIGVACRADRRRLRSCCVLALEVGS